MNPASASFQPHSKANGAPVNGVSPAQDLLQDLYQAPDSFECRQAALKLAEHVRLRGLAALFEEDILPNLVQKTRSKSGIERESALLGLGTLFTQLGSKDHGADAFFLPLWPDVLERLQEVGKAQVVADAAEFASKALLDLVLPETVLRAVDILFAALETSSIKWRSKVGALDAISALTGKGTAQVAEHLGEIIPRLTTQMSDTKAEVSAAAIKAANVVCSVLTNPDALPFVPLLVECMAHPDRLAEGVKKLSSNVWVRDVDAPTLAVMVPLMSRSLNDRNTTVQRQTVMLIANMFKLVRSPDLAARHLPSLLPGVTRIYESAAFPEIRAFAEEAKQVLENSVIGAATNASEDLEKKQVVEDQKLALQSLVSLYTSESQTPPSPSALTSLKWVATTIAQLVTKRDFGPEQWKSVYVGPYLDKFLPTDQAQRVCAEALKKSLEVDRVRNQSGLDDLDDADGEVLTNIPFSLAYGGLLLLNHTVLRLIRGHRYGVCGANGAGKSTLLKAINRKQIENFPEHLTTFYVEHDIDSSESGETCHSFILHDKFVKEGGASEERILRLLEECGFTAERRALAVGALSGGWKMRLALARAMICGADILLLDEPTNHLDVGSVAWLQEYLCAQKDVTVMVVSHDSGFLDAICTDIIHYESKRLVYYKGNLKAFVDKHPAAQSYYTLSASIVKLEFPPPGALVGVRSQTRAILKMTNCTFTYPGAPKPSLHNVSCAVSLSSRIGIVGPNGAGKSTLIKLLTGETIPDTGKVDKHPNLRVAYIAQHAFHHIEEHLEKSATAYIKWRYADGTDKEMAAKASRRLSPEEKRILATPIEAKTGEKRQIEMIIGRQKLKKSFTYEIKWKNLDHRFNTWIPRERLFELGFSKIVQQFDDFEASREGSGSRELSGKAVREHLEGIGLDGNIAEYNEMSGLSGGQKVKVAIAAALWSKPQVLILDEPTNFLDREALGGLAVAIRNWPGAFVCISHNVEFVQALCSEIWEVDDGRLTHKGKVAVTEDAFDDFAAKAESRETSRSNTPSVSKGAARMAAKLAARTPGSSGKNSAESSVANTPIATPAGSGDEAARTASPDAALPKVQKKKLTRKQVKEREERRRKRTLDFLTSSVPGAVREPDTESD